MTTNSSIIETPNISTKNNSYSSNNLNVNSFINAKLINSDNLSYMNPLPNNIIPNYNYYGIPHPSNQNIQLYQIHNNNYVQYAFIANQPNVIAIPQQYFQNNKIIRQNKQDEFNTIPKISPMNMDFKQLNLLNNSVDQGINETKFSQNPSNNETFKNKGFQINMDKSNFNFGTYIPTRIPFSTVVNQDTHSANAQGNHININKGKVELNSNEKSNSINEQFNFTDFQKVSQDYFIENGNISLKINTGMNI